jgi:hypothetical protein
MYTGPPAVIFVRLPAAGDASTIKKAKARKKYFPCMKSNFKTLMIKIMTLIKKSGKPKSSRTLGVPDIYPDAIKKPGFPACRRDDDG